jgi:HEAT repeat protein
MSGTVVAARQRIRELAEVARPKEGVSSALDVVRVFEAALWGRPCSDDENEVNLRCEAVKALGAMESPAAFPSLRRALLSGGSGSSADKPVQRAALEAVIALASVPELRGEVAAVLSDARGRVDSLRLRVDLSATLVALGEREDPRVFLDALQSGEYGDVTGMLEEAFTALAKQDDKQALELMIGTLERAPHVSLVQPLEDLTGLKLGPGGVSWASWLSRNQHDLPAVFARTVAISHELRKWFEDNQSTLPPQIR